MYCTECGTHCDEGTKFCPECGYPLDPTAAPTPAPSAPAPAPVRAPVPSASPAKGTNLKLAVYNKLMLLLMLWPSIVYWTEIFAIKVRGKEEYCFRFMDFSDLFAMSRKYLGFLMDDNYKNVTSMLGAVKYIFIAAAILAAVRYIKGWLHADNGRPVRLWAIMRCYILPILLAVAGANIWLYTVQQKTGVDLLTSFAGKISLWPTKGCILAMLAPLVIGCIAKPFFTSKK